MRNGAWPTRVLGAVGAPFLAFLGIQVMRRPDPFSLLPSLPTAKLSIVFPNPQWVEIGTACMLLGCILAFVWLPPRGFIAVPSDSEAIGTPPDRAVDRTIHAGMAAVAGLLYVYVLERAWNHDGGPLAIFALIVVPILITSAIWDLAPSRGRSRKGTLLPFSRFDVVFIVSIGAAFIALNLHDIRYWFYAWIGDEWQFFDAARVIARGNSVDMLSQNGVDFIFPVVNSVYQSLFMHVLGVNVVGWRLSSIVSAAIPVTALYWLGKQFGGVPFAIAASGFYMSCDLLWAFAHIGYNNNDALLAMVPAAALFYAAMQSNRLSLMFTSGAACGAGWYTIYTARLMIGILGLILLIDLFRSPRTTIQRIIFLMGGFLMVALPLLLDSGWDVLRTMSHNTPGDLGDNPYSLLLPRNIVRALYEFFYNTSTNHYITGAIFTQIAAAALAIGTAISLRGLGTTAVRLILMWFVVTLLLTTPLNDASAVSFTRSMIIVPPASLLAALGLCSVARALQRISPRAVSAAIFPLVIALTLSGAAALDGYRFFVTMPRLMYANDLSMVIGVLTAHPDTMAVLAGQMANPSICIVLDGYGISDARVLRFSHGALARLCGVSAGRIHAVRNSVLVLVNDGDRTTLASCGARLTRLLQAPNKLSAMYGFSVQTSPDPVATYLPRAAAEVRQACPLVAGLPAD